MKYQGLRLFNNQQLISKPSLTQNSTTNGSLIQSTMKAELVSYKESFEGIISSFQDRLPYSEAMVHQWINEWNRYKDYLRVPALPREKNAEEKSIKKVTRPTLA